MADEMDLDLIRRTLAGFDAETRHQVIEAMKEIRRLPIPVAVRILASARSHFPPGRGILNG